MCAELGPRGRHSSKHFAPSQQPCEVSFRSSILQMRVWRPRDGERTCPRSHSSSTVELEFESGTVIPEPTLPHRCQSTKGPLGSVVHRSLLYFALRYPAHSKAVLKPGGASKPPGGKLKCTLLGLSASF